jgi:hypothetical protein
MLVAWLALSSPGVELVDEEFVMGQVAEIIKRERASGPPVPVDAGMAIAVVELPDGGKTRVFALHRKISVGGQIRLKVKNYSDGTRQVIGAGDRSKSELPM